MEIIPTDYVYVKTGCPIIVGKLTYGLYGLFSEHCKGMWTRIALKPTTFTSVKEAQETLKEYKGKRISKRINKE